MEGGSIRIQRTRSGRGRGGTLTTGGQDSTEVHTEAFHQGSEQRQGGPDFEIGDSARSEGGVRAIAHEAWAT